MRPLLLLCNVMGKIAAFVVWHRSHLAAVACFITPDLALLYGMLAPASQFLCPVVTSFRSAAGRREIWLTIDDGPDPVDTPRLLELLDRHGAKATFFAVGCRAAEHPEWVRELVRRGHQLGHHTQTHPQATFWLAGPARVRRELDLALAAFRAAGAAPAIFRPPVGIKNVFLRRALSRRGLTCIGWTVRSGDCFRRDPRRAVARVLRRLQPGAIVLAHEGPSVPPGMRVVFLSQLLEALDAHGYRCIIPGPEQWLPTGATALRAAAAAGEPRRRPA